MPFYPWVMVTSQRTWLALIFPLSTRERLRKTTAFWDIVDASRAPEDAESLGSFDHFIGAGEQRRRNFEPERFRYN
jgi:hypothetical protein